MKKIAEIFIVFTAVLTLASCSNPFNDIRVTSCELVSASPRGLSAFDAVLDVSVDNPAPQITLSGANAVVKLEGVPCLYLTADDVTIMPKTELIYPVTLHGTLDSGFNPFALLSLIKAENWELMTVDVFFYASLKSGLGKHFEYRNLPLKDVLGTI